MDRAGEDQPKRQQGRKRTYATAGHLPDPASSSSSNRRCKYRQHPSSTSQQQQQPSNEASSSSGFPPGSVNIKSRPASTWRATDVETMSVPVPRTRAAGRTAVTLSACSYAELSETSFAKIPVVDFGAYSLSVKDVPDEQQQSLIKELKSAFTKVGFVFLKNTGISQEEVDDIMDISKKFFLQPDELKQPFSRKSFSNSPNHGWVSLETERLNPRRPGDLKESFNTTSLRPDIKWPSSGSLKCFKEIQTTFFRRCKELSLRVLRVMAHSLGLDPEVFLSTHRLIGTDKNGTTLRSLYYPPVNREKAKEGQVRCGEHSDYGTFTLLIQSSEGLQVRALSGEFISVPCIPGAILVNIADLMQRWTSDQFVSVVHRVLLPPVGDSSTRQSLAFFVHPDDEALITCCDNSNKYPPITAGDYLTERFSDSYGRS